MTIRYDTILVLTIRCKAVVLPSRPISGSGHAHGRARRLVRRWRRFQPVRTDTDRFLMIHKRCGRTTYRRLLPHAHKHALLGQLRGQIPQAPTSSIHVRSETVLPWDMPVTRNTPADRVTDDKKGWSQTKMSSGILHQFHHLFRPSFNPISNTGAARRSTNLAIGS